MNQSTASSTAYLIPIEKVKNRYDYIIRGINNHILFYPMWDSFFCADKSIDYENNRKWITEYEDKIRAIYEMDDHITSSTIELLIDERKKGHFEFLSNEKLDEYEFVPYFGRETFYPEGKVTFLDAGAYVGDTIDSLTKNSLFELAKVYAFEPDPVNYSKLQSYISEQGIIKKTTMFNSGLWDKETMLRFVSDGLTSYVEETSDSEILDNKMVSVLKADDVVDSVEGTLCIKMDIEGSEIKALRGCSSLIQRYNPYMAICLYHKMKDILEIPLTINKINPDYKFYIRAGYHTVLYAVPDI